LRVPHTQTPEVAASASQYSSVAQLGAQNETPAEVVEQRVGAPPSVGPQHTELPTVHPE
jgi:hypothetical protein